METITIGISGMHCDGCVNSVTESLKKLDGIESLKVSLEAKYAMITYDPTRVTREKFKMAIEDAGFDVV